MKKLISILLAGVMLLSLSAAAFAEGEAPDYATGTPWLCVDLDGNVTPDTPAELKDNFALYINKDAILGLEIPEGYPYAGTVMDIVLQQADDVRNMFLGEEPETHDAKLAYHLFQLMMDWDSRNALGISPLKKETDILEAIDTTEALRAYFLEVPVEDQLSGLWSSWMDTDLDDSDRHILAVSDVGLLLEDSAEYEELTEYGVIKKDAITELAQKMLGKLGYTEEEVRNKIDNCFAFETMLAPAIYTNEEQGSEDYLSRINNHYSREELAEAQGQLPILEDLEKAGFPEAEDYMVMNPDYLVKINELLTEENLPLIKDYMIVHSAVNAAGNLDRECYEWAYDCSNAISGAVGMLDDETVFSSSVAATLEWPVAQLYTEMYLKQEDKDRIAEMVDEILETYHGILSEADFLSETTRERAIEKLDAIEPRVLYPDSWEKYDCEGLEIASPAEGGTLWEACRSITRYLIAKEVKEYPDPVDKEKWFVTPQTVNAFYNPQDNSITILGAFAQGNLYNSAMSDEELYAKLGTIIGHEISHAFDRSGAQFDSDGNWENWWTDEDYATFQERNAKLEAYYDAMHPWEGQDFYGSIMTGEACADMAGMKTMLRIAAGRENFDYDAFFRAYAELWLTKETLQRAYAVINDNHPMPYLRINSTLQQYDEFLDFYEIREGDGMYLAPEDRVNIW